MFYLTEDLVSSVKRRSLAPSSQKTFQDTDIISLANEELQLSLVPDIISVREDYFLRSKDISLVSGLNHYPLPERAAGNAIKDVFFVNGSEKRELNKRELRHVSLSDNTGEPSTYCFEGDEILLDSVPSSSSGSLRVWFFERPNQLIESSSCSKITSVASLAGTTTFTVNTDLSASLAVGSKIDLLNAQSPFLLWARDVTVTAITSSTISVATSEVIDETSTVTPGVNDYICPRLKSNIPQVPEEFHPILAQMVVERLMEAMGDLNKLAAVKAKILEMKQKAFLLISNRVESSPAIVMNRNGIMKSFYRGIF